MLILKNVNFNIVITLSAAKIIMENYMKLNEKQYETLVKMLYLANWVVEESSEDPNSDYSALEQHVLSMAKEYGFDKNVVFDEESKLSYLSEEYEESTDLFDIIDGYESELINNTLAFHFAEAEVDEKFPSLEGEEFDEKADELSDKYFEKFQKEGLDILRLK